MEFKKFQKIPRLSRECVITEKIDGTNGVIYIGEDGEFLVGSRTRWLNPQTGDNHGFYMWAITHKEELMKLGVGFHYGEWWGSGIQRGYGLVNGDKRFSLFNVGRWVKDKNKVLEDKQEYCPDCCDVVPIVGFGLFTTEFVDITLNILKNNGSYVSKGFMKPEGVVIYHTQARLLFKKTIEKDEEHKGFVKE